VPGDFISQTDNFTTNLVPNPSYAQWNQNNAAFSVYFGTNDINSLSTKVDSSSTTDYTPYAVKAMASLFTTLDVLYTAGARRFLLFNMSPLDRAPSHLDASGVPNASIASFVSAWNDELNLTAQNFGQGHPSSSITLVDAHAAFTVVLDNPAGYNAPNASCWNNDGKSCLWYDVLHPGQAIHASLAKAVDRACIQSGLYSSGAREAQDASATVTARSTVTQKSILLTPSSTSAAGRGRNGGTIVLGMGLGLMWLVLGTCL